MLKLVTGFLLILCLGAAPATAQSDTDTDASIDNLLGDHVFYREAFDTIQQAMADDDREALAGLVSYPIKVTTDGEEMTIDSVSQFVEEYDSIITDEIKDAVAGQKWQDLFVNYQGVMFGNGQIWLNGICTTDSCAEFDVKIITIQSTAS